VAAPGTCSQMNAQRWPSELGWARHASTCRRSPSPCTHRSNRASGSEHLGDEVATMGSPSAYVPTVVWPRLDMAIRQRFSGCGDGRGGTNWRLFAGISAQVAGQRLGLLVGGYHELTPVIMLSGPDPPQHPPPPPEVTWRVMVLQVRGENDRLQPFVMALPVHVLPIVLSSPRKNPSQNTS
jgi:hypothetical protein